MPEDGKETVDGEPVTDSGDQEGGGGLGLALLVVVLIAGVLFGNNRQ